ncbi:Crp/Fnr family transcriptional regulator [Sulfurospirillum sp. 1307]
MNRIKEIPFFSELSSKDLEKLKKISTIKKYNAKEIVFYEGDEPKYLHVLLDGILRLYKTNYKGNQIFLHQFLPVSLVAELANFESIAYPASAEFVTKGEILLIDYERLESDFFKNPDLSLKIIRSLAGKLKIMSEVVTNEVVLNSEAKIAKFIVENKELFEKLKNTQIASILNITPETLSRTLTKFKSKDIILEDDKHKIIIKNEEELLKLYI